MVTLELDTPITRKAAAVEARYGANHFSCSDGPYNHTAGEQALWRAVIVQALMDAASLSHKAENLNHRREALIWLRGRSEDFHRVCHYAGLDPDCTREMIRGALERGCAWRVAPGMGERASKDSKTPTARR